MTIKAVLFDKDGTLINFASTFFQACFDIIHSLGGSDNEKVIQLAKAVGYDLSTKSCPGSSQIVGGTSLTIAACWQPFLNRNSVEDLSRELDQYFDEHTQSSVTEFVFTEPTLTALSTMGIKLGVATNDSEHNAHRHLRSIAIDDLFCFVAGYDSGHGSKPEPGIVRAFANQTGFATSQIAMVGDSINDIIAGKSAGALSIAVTSGIATYDELNSHADYTIGDISQLPDLLKQISVSSKPDTPY